MSHFILEVYDSRRIYGDTHEPCLEVKMRTAASACIASESDRLTGFYPLVGLHEETRQVAVDRLHAVVMTYHYVIAVTAALEFGQSDFAVECRTDSISYRKFQVDTAVDTAITPTVAIVGSDMAGNRKYPLTSISFESGIIALA